MVASSVPSILQPLGSHNSTCGYCSPPGQRSAARSSVSQGLDPIQLSCGVYQQMIDRGWRRSGTYCYKPDLRQSCCPQYTIKLDALAFIPSKSQRKLVNRFNRFVIHGDEKEEGMEVDGQAGSKNKKPKGAPPFALTTAIHAAERGFVEAPVHDLEVTLEPASFTSEKFALFCKYQADIHQDEDKSSAGFTRFLVDSPLTREKIEYPGVAPAHLPTEYGAYHQLYRLDGELIAMGVIDILPACVSSVYFMYDATWARFSLGKLSALREAALAQELHAAGLPALTSLYMGFYIHSCAKMRYKADYAPSYLADPETYAWVPLPACAAQLDVHRYACFSDPGRSTTVVPPRGLERPRRFEDAELRGVRVLVVDEGSRQAVAVVPITQSAAWRSTYQRRALEEGIAGLGLKLAREVIFAT